MVMCSRNWEIQLQIQHSSNLKYIIESTKNQMENGNVYKKKRENPRMDCTK